MNFEQVDHLSFRAMKITKVNDGGVIDNLTL